MKNPLQLVDDTLMNGVNKGVRAWNWTTGKTKEDLAKYMLTVAPIFECTGFATLGGPLLYLGIPLSLYLSHIDINENKEIANLEQKAIEGGCLSKKVENSKERNKLFGYYFGGSGLFNIGVGEPTGSFSSTLFGTGFFIRGSAYHIMRANSLPPRKSVFSRTKGKIVEYLQRPTLEPAFEHAQIQTDLRSY
ncbi:MAG: hypothetical protein ABIH72_02775 [archaeon]